MYIVVCGRESRGNRSGSRGSWHWTQRCALAVLIIKRHIDLSSNPVALHLQDPVPISCRIYLSPTMPLGRHHSRCEKEPRAPKTRGAKRRKRRSLCRCVDTQTDGSLVDMEAGFKPLCITQVQEIASAECQIRSCCCLKRFGLMVMTWAWKYCSDWCHQNNPFQLQVEPQVDPQEKSWGWFKWPSLKLHLARTSTLQ